MSSLSQSQALAAAISAAIGAAIERGDLVGTIPVTIPLERPKNRDHGDYATSVALQLAKPAGMSPRAVAELLQSALLDLPEVTAVEIAGPGFINITLNRSSQAEFGHNNFVSSYNIWNREFSCGRFSELGIY